MRNDKTTVHSAVDTSNRLDHQHVTMITPPNEDVTQQVPPKRVSMHRRHLLPHWQTECVGQGMIVICAGMQEKLIAVAATDSVATWHCHPRSVVCADADLEATKSNHFAHLQRSHSEDMQVFVELVLHIIGVGVSRV
ncbi:hypothetical protein SprV_0501899100 [Sparganum proliferum]